MTVLFNSSSLCAFISFIIFFECLLFLSCWSDHASTACKCTVWSCVLYIPFEMNQGKCMFFCLILIEPSVQVSYKYTAIECVQITETNWWKKIYQLSFRTLLDVFKNVEFERGSKFTLIFFSIFMYIVPPIQTNHLLAYLLWKCFYIEIDIKIIIAILFYFITIEPTDHFGEHVFCKRTPGLQLLK